MMGMRSTCSASLVATLALSCLSASALANDPAPAFQPRYTDLETDSFQISPYLWAAGLEGTISPFEAAPTVDVDDSFSDILSDLTMAGFLDIRGRHERYVFASDLMFIDTEQHENVDAVTGVGDTPGLEAKLVSKQLSLSLTAGYRLYNAPNTQFDLLAGARAWHISTEIKAKYEGESESYSEDFGWIDPIVSMRLNTRLTPRLTLLAQTDVGGFGVGSDFTWLTFGALNYTINDGFSASVGYRTIDVDYDDDGHVFDATMRGPILGLTYSF